MASASNLVMFPADARALDPFENDSQARSAALATQRSAIVEAPAGSGKTGLLVQRFLKLLGDQDTTQPEEVLAVTFTNKATAELLDRILGHLQNAASNRPLAADTSAFEQQTRHLAAAVLERDHLLGWGLLDQPRRLQVRTFDAVCLALANGLPLLSGSNGARTPVLDAQPLYRTAARRTLMLLGGSNDALTAALSTVLLHRDASLPNVESLLASMLATRDQWGELVPLDRTMDDRMLDEEVRPRLERALESIVCAGLNHALRSIPARILEDIAAFAARYADLPGYKEFASPISVCAGRHLPPPAAAEHLDHWVALVHLLTLKDVKWRSSLNANHIQITLGKAEKAALQQIIAELQDHPDSETMLQALCDVRCLPPARYPDEQWLVAKALFLVLRHALVELKLLFAEREEADFIEFSLAARTALRDATSPDPSAPDSISPIDLVLSSGSRLRHLLVDEMQDTSSAQYELIELLTRSWDGHSQTLFLVGDPKQSIYLFRQARVERFLQTIRAGRLGDIPLETLQLTANFRSQTGLVAAFNDTFARIFPARAASAADVPFVAATGTRSATPGPAIDWHTRSLADTPEGKQPPPDPRRQEARGIRELAEQHLAANPLARISILAASRSHLADIVVELKRDRGHGPLPFRGIDLDSLAELPEILDLLALTRALLHPADRIAWLAVLHAPWCGLGLADLLTLTGEGDTALPMATVTTLLRERRHRLSPIGRQLVDRIWPPLETAVATLGRTSLSLQVERTWRSLGGDAALDAEALSNTEQYFRLLRELEAASPVLDLGVLSTRLKKLYAAPAAGDHIRVDLLTIHRAKGLEWDVVFVPGLERKPQGSSEDLLNWLELDDAGSDASIVLAPIAGKGQESSQLSAWLRTQRSRREAAERKRLFYVAATRAREHLHLFATLKRKQDGSLCVPGSTTLLHAAWPAAEQHFVTPSAFDEALEAALANLDEPHKTDTFSIAAAEQTDDALSIEHPPPMLDRLPLTFNARDRFLPRPGGSPFPLHPAAQPVPAFARPEGSFAVRAFGNVVHRFLQQMADSLEGTPNVPALLAELPSWSRRLHTSFRSEGLASAAAAREAERALDALTRTLSDPTGIWLLSPHPSAASEAALTTALERRSLRIDRTFVAGLLPLSDEPACTWVVDFKTTTQGARSDEAFAAAELAKYGPQMQAYAALLRSLPSPRLPVRLALYYPLLPRLIELPDARAL